MNKYLSIHNIKLISHFELFSMQDMPFLDPNILFCSKMVNFYPLIDLDYYLLNWIKTCQINLEYYQFICSLLLNISLIRLKSALFNSEGTEILEMVFNFYSRFQRRWEQQQKVPKVLWDSLLFIGLGICLVYLIINKTLRVV